MKLIILSLVIGIVVVGIIGIFAIISNYDDDSSNFEQQNKFQSSIENPILTDSKIVQPQFIFNENASPVILDEPSFLQNLQPSTESIITPEIIEANEFYEDKKYLEALSLYDSVLVSDPTNVYALNGKAGTLLSLKEFDASIVAFEKTLHLYPDNVNAMNGKAYALYLKAFPYVLPGLFYDSVHTYQQALQLDPKNLNALIGTASALSALERYDEAVQYYHEALSVDPENDNARNGLINLWIKRGNAEVHFFYFEPAIAYFDKALELDPINVNALLAKAGAYTEWGKSKQVHYSTAESMFNKILQLYPDNSQALLGMGYVLNEQLEFERALPYYERVLELDPDSFNGQRGKSLALRHVLYGG